jgi:hypothetical protein
MPYFLELRNGFTKYSLTAALTLTSIYSQKLYELLSRWKDKKEWFVSLDELKTLLNAKNYAYPQLKQKCLDRGIQEINQKTDLQVTWEPEKTGKSVTAIRFFIKSKAVAERDDAKEAVNEELKQISQLSPGQISLYTQKLFTVYSFTKKQQDLLMSKPSLFGEFVELESKIANGLIKNVLNPTAYMAKVLFKIK